MSITEDAVNELIGPLPPEWNAIRSGALFTFKNGLNYTADQVGTGVQVIGVGDFGDRMRLAHQEFQRVQVPPGLDQSYFLHDNDLLFVRSNGNKALVGRVLFLAGIKDRISHSGFTIRGRLASEEVNPLFAAYFFSSLLVKQQFIRLGGGTNISNLSQDILKNVIFPRPPLNEQEKIAAILSTWDQGIESIENLITAKKRRKSALLQQLFAGKVRFRRFVKSAETFSTRYGDFPKDWDYVRLEQIAKDVSERNIGGMSHQVLSCTKYDGLVDSLEYFGKQIFSKDLSSYRIVRRNQFAYATNHIEEGSIGYQDLCDIALISPMYTVFETNNQVNDSFIYKLLKSDIYVKIYQENMSASVDRRGSLRWTEFSKIRIPLPTIEEQEAIATVIDSQQQEIELLKKKLEALKQQKRSLMQQLLTGKVRVKVPEESPRG